MWASATDSELIDLHAALQPCCYNIMQGFFPQWVCCYLPYVFICQVGRSNENDIFVLAGSQYNTPSACASMKPQEIKKCKVAIDANKTDT